MTPESQSDATTLKLSSILSSLDAELSTTPSPGDTDLPAFVGAQPLNLSSIDLVEADGLQGVGGALRLADVDLPEYPDHLGPIDAGEHAALELLFRASRVPGFASAHSLPEDGAAVSPDDTAQEEFHSGSTQVPVFDFPIEPESFVHESPRPPRNRPELSSVEATVSCAKYALVDTTETFVDFNNDVHPGRNVVPSGVYLLRHGARIHALGEDSRGRFTLGASYRLADNATQGSRMCVAFDALSIYSFSDKLLLNTDQAYTFLSYYDQSTGRTLVVRVLISDIESVQAASGPTVIQWFKSASVESTLKLYKKLFLGNKRKPSGLEVPLLSVLCAEDICVAVEPVAPVIEEASSNATPVSMCASEADSLLAALADVLQKNSVSMEMDPRFTTELCSCLRSISALERELHVQRSTVATLLSTLGRRA